MFTVKITMKGVLELDYLVLSAVNFLILYSGVAGGLTMMRQVPL